MPIADLPDIPADEVKAEHRIQRVAQIRDYFAMLARVDSVAFRVKIANREFCNAKTPALGFYAVTVRSLPRKYRSFSHEALNVSWTKPTVIAVTQGSPAAEAGIMTGDQILTLDNLPVPPTKTSAWIGDFLDNNSNHPIVALMRRDGVEKTVVIQPVMTCAFPVKLMVEGEANAYTDYKKIVIQSGILRLIRTDADLAVIIGHELAHVTMGHYGKKLQNALTGALGGAAIDGAFMLGGIYTDGTFSKHFEKVGARAFSVGFEREADYVGAYYAVRAGYDISNSENVWRRMALEDPDSIRFAKTHPTTPERFIFLRQAVAEIKNKISGDLPLRPDLKATETSSEPSAPSGY